MRFFLFVSFFFLIEIPFLWAFRVQTTSEQTGNHVVRWAISPIPILIHKDGAKDVTDGSDIQAIKEAFLAWAAPKCNNLAFSFATTTITSFAGRPIDPKFVTGPKDRDGKSVIRFESKKWEWSDAILLKKSVVFDPQSGQIKETDLLFNDVHYKWSTDQKPDTIDIKSAIFQQVGFMLGLWYSENSKAIMHESYDYRTQRNKLHADDIKGICFLYPTSGWKDVPPPEPSSAGEPIVEESSNSTDASWPPPLQKTPPPSSHQGCQCQHSSYVSIEMLLLIFLIFPFAMRRRSR